MNSITEIKEAILADYIQEIQKYSKDRLVQEIINIKIKQLRMLDNGKAHIKNYGRTNKSN